MINLQAISTNDAALKNNLANLAKYSITLNNLNSSISANNQNLNGQVVAISGSIDLKSVGATELFEIPSGYKFIIDSVIVECTECTALSTEAVVSIGSNASDYNNLISSETLTGLNAIDKFYKKEVTGAKAIIQAAESVFVKINTAMTGTSQTAIFYLLGLLRGV